jgi:hypothetical protein
METRLHQRLIAIDNALRASRTTRAEIREPFQRRARPGRFVDRTAPSLPDCPREVAASQVVRPTRTRCRTSDSQRQKIESPIPVVAHASSRARGGAIFVRPLSCSWSVCQQRPEMNLTVPTVRMLPDGTLSLQARRFDESFDRWNGRIAARPDIAEAARCRLT